MAPLKDNYFLIPRTCDYVALQGKRVFAVVINLKILRWGLILDHLGGSTVFTKVFIRERGRQNGQRKRCDEAERSERYYTPGFKAGERGHEPRNTGNL